SRFGGGWLKRKITIEGLLDAPACGLGEHPGGRSGTGGVDRHLCCACSGDCAHEVSILIAMIGADGRCRGVEPRWKISMMIMRPPQHGQGRETVGVWLPSLL